MPVIKKILPGMLLVWCTTAAALAADPDCNENSPAEALAKGNNTFALKLFGQLRSTGDNLFFSPYSIRMALAMTYAGARGKTAAQMKTALAFSHDGAALHTAFADSINALITTAGCSYEMNIANSLWTDKSRAFLEPFIQITKTIYGGALEQVDFIHNSENARTKINTWVEQQTRSKIKDLIPPGGVNAGTRLALVNAVYFKGRWSEEFDKERTSTQPFYCAGKRIVDVPFMTHAEPKSLPFYAGDGVRILELGYLGDAVSMVIVLPDKADGLAAIEDCFDEALLTVWLNKLHKQKVYVHLPRFSMSWGAKNIAPHLRVLGMQDAFTSGAADFSGIDGTRELLITGIFHKAFVDVSEEGTEAAAATGVMVGVTSMPAPPEIFRADHPFLFLIRDKATGTILFMGRMAEPAAD